MRKLSVVVTLTLFAAACGGTTSSSSEAEAAEEVESVMQAFLDALEVEDWPRAREHVSPQFQLLEDGRRMSWSEARAMIEEAGFERVDWTLSGFETRIADDVAYTTYINHGRFVVEHDTLEVEFLESAVLRRVTGSWRVALLHSSVIPDEGEGPGPDPGDGSGATVEGEAGDDPGGNGAP
ncbi:MAG: nuclear transport factor 2 family protein [Gemmatimonadota bacterium]